LEEAVIKVFDLRPAAIIRDLELQKPIYRRLAAYGPYGTQRPGCSLEDTDRTQALLDALKL
jgi:S-adenosylmethionine synthetase